VTGSNKARLERMQVVTNACQAVTVALEAAFASRGLLFVLTVLDPETGQTVVRSNGDRYRVRQALEDALAATKAGFGIKGG
jgi:hypothetical protein